LELKQRQAEELQQRMAVPGLVNPNADMADL
jgi:hypothetical protein